MNKREIAVEIAEIMGWDIEDVLRRVEFEQAHPGISVKEAWLDANPSADSEIERFYSDTTSYIFDLAVESTREVRQQWRAAVVDALNRQWGGAEAARVLDFGGGVGTDTLYFAKHCRAAYYYDVPGATSTFAMKRFARRGAPITRVTRTSNYGAEFDAVVSFEVLEHLLDPCVHLDELVRLTRPGGLLFLTESFTLVGEDYPSHLPRHKYLAGKLDDLMIERGCRPLQILENRIHTYVKGPRVTVIVPIYNAYDHVRRLLDSIMQTSPGYPVRWMLVNDASSDPRISSLLHDFSATFQGVHEIVDRSENLGFVQTCNSAMTAAESDDVILLNSDTILYDGWARALLQAAYQAPDIGTATPLSNNASCYSMFQYVSPACRLNKMLAQAEMPSLDIPVGVGYCLYIKRELLDRVGMFDPVFEKGYGEETDLCLRAKAAGYRHVLATTAFVYHAGSASMIAANVVNAGESTIAEHERIVSKRYPDFERLVHDFIASGVTEALEYELNARYILHESSRRPSIAMVVHDDIFAAVVGGTTFHIRDLVRDLEQDFVFYFITPEAGKVRVAGYVDGVVHTFVPRTRDYAGLLADLNASVVHIHHLMNFPADFVEAVISWQGPKIFTIHDYYGVCPQYNLINYRQVYCGVPEQDECDRCARKLFGTGYATPMAQRQTFGRLVDSATTVISPSRAALEVFSRAVPVPDEKVRIVPHSFVVHRFDDRIKHRFNSVADRALSVLDAANSAVTGATMRGSVHGAANSTARRPGDSSDSAPRTRSKAQLRVGFIGYSAPHKGTSLLQGIVTACSADPITFVAIGDIGSSARDRSNVVTTGRFRREDAIELIQSFQVDVMVVASGWPETYSYTLTEAWMAGVPVIVGPFGALAERVAETGAGLVMPDYRVQTFVAALRGLLRDEAQLGALKRAVTAVKIQQDYNEYRDLYNQHARNAPVPSRLFSAALEHVANAGPVAVDQVPIVARLVNLRKRIFPVGTVRERMYFFLHDRISRSYAGGVRH
jgi:GT2 family glycosyltransferase/glycosyltransferase involved in cell wall biosynthesis